MIVLGFVAAAAVATLIRWTVGAYLNAEVPLGTFFVNVAASLALGYVAASNTGSSVVLQVAFLGALSTWSSLANEVATMMRASKDALAALYLGCTLVAGIAAAWLGLLLG